MELNELISAAASIAGQLATRDIGTISAGRIQEIARNAVEIARQIEEEARRSYG
jgi:hypothetical protein